MTVRRSGPRNILLTGATSGIGLALAGRLSKRHRILTTGRISPPALEELIASRPDTAFVKADLSEPAEAASWIMQAIAANGWEKLDNAILNAGIGYARPAQAETPEIIRETLAINLNANIALAQALFPLLKKAGGKLTFIGTTARKGASGFATYAASKAALHGFARALREEWRGKVAVQILHPGPTRTAMHEKAGYDPGRFATVFADADGMAAMIENAIARPRFAMNLTPLHYWSGGPILGRGLQ